MAFSAMMPEKRIDGRWYTRVCDSETAETWLFRLQENGAVGLIQGRSGRECGTLFMSARDCAVGRLSQMARIDDGAKIDTSSPNVTIFKKSAHTHPSRRKDWRERYGLAGTGIEEDTR